MDERAMSLYKLKTSSNHHNKKLINLKINDDVVLI